MKRALSAATLLCAVVFASPAVADDLQKAEKQINRITAMSSDMTARRIVSRTVSDTLNVKRPQLQQERRAMNLNYGFLFLAHQLTATGASMSDIAAQLKAGKNVVQIANDRHADWKRIAVEAKKMNDKIEDNLYKFFLNDTVQRQHDEEDQYHSVFDVVSADVLVSQEDLDKAQQTYLFWKDRVGQRKGAALDADSEREARRTYDPVRSGDQPGQTSRSGPTVAVGPPH